MRREILDPFTTLSFALSMHLRKGEAHLKSVSIVALEVATFFCPDPKHIITKDISWPIKCNMYLWILFYTFFRRNRTTFLCALIMRPYFDPDSFKKWQLFATPQFQMVAATLSKKCHQFFACYLICSFFFSKAPHKSGNWRQNAWFVRYFSNPDHACGDKSSPLAFTNINFPQCYI